MTTYAHKKIAEAIATHDRVPHDPTEFREWLRAGRHLDYLQENATNDERIVYASSPLSFVHTIAVPSDALASGDPAALLNWNTNAFTSIANYVSGGGRDTIWIERGTEQRGSPILNAGINLIFGRTFEGWAGSDRTYFEVNQEYTHLSGIHWRPERSAYCRFDENGDLTDVVSETFTQKSDGVTLVTFTWPELEEYLGIGRYVLVRMFDFTLCRHGQFPGWGDGSEEIVRVSEDLFYRQKIVGNAAYTRGVQIIRPRDAKIITDEHCQRWLGRAKDEHVTFIAQDWRHNKVFKISTDPAQTTNYFDASKNDLPFELSPAFFRPEVLSKYKTDREKYRIDDREVRCRSSWTLEAYDINEAGQVFAYVCYLRNLPHSEKLHWKSFNEAPKTGISERAFTTDFMGEFVKFEHPRTEILSILRHWEAREVRWWTLLDEELLSRANPPISSSKDEWAEAVMDLSKLVIEGFDVKFLRKILGALGEDYSDNGSIALLEKILAARDSASGPVILAGLRAAQQIRSKVKGHAGGSKGKAIAQEALAKHGTYGAHFNYLCELVERELRTIESALKLPGL